MCTHVIGRSREELRRYDDITLIGTEEHLEHYWKFDERFGDKIFDFFIPEGAADLSFSQLSEILVQGKICGVERSNLASPVQAGAYTDEAGDYIVGGVYYGTGTTFQVKPEKETSIWKNTCVVVGSLTNKGFLVETFGRRSRAPKVPRRKPPKRSPDRDEFRGGVHSKKEKKNKICFRTKPCDSS